MTKKFRKESNLTYKNENYQWNWKHNGQIY